VTADKIPSCLLGPLIGMGEQEQEAERARRRMLPSGLELQEERSRRADLEDLEAVASDDSDRDEDWTTGAVSYVENGISKQRAREGGGDLAPQTHTPHHILEFMLQLLDAHAHLSTKDTPGSRACSNPLRAPEGSEDQAPQRDPRQAGPPCSRR
jgi:hypothetical protein